jgi:sterol desaturase/sphingolipid hydroxylase (fatty acid hydroxylase superfamily)
MNQILYSFAVFWLLGFLAFAAEWLFPGRKIAYRTVLLRDLTALGVYNVLFAVVVVFTDRIPVPNYVPTALVGTPLALKLVLFFIVEDFGLYWVHRLMHTNYFWRTHKWHHYPKYMYWLAGVRTAIPHIILFNLTFILARPLLRGAPIWIFQLILAEHTFRNNWMHMNVAWKLSWLEWFVVTPRYHQIHHSDDPQHYRSNMASLLTIWDRLFGTYYNPDLVKKPLTFGINEKINPVRLVLGV